MDLELASFFFYKTYYGKSLDSKTILSIIVSLSRCFKCIMRCFMIQCEYLLMNSISLKNRSKLSKYLLEMFESLVLYKRSLYFNAFPFFAICKNIVFFDYFPLFTQVLSMFMLSTFFHDLC